MLYYFINLTKKRLTPREKNNKKRIGVPLTADEAIKIEKAVYLRFVFQIFYPLLEKLKKYIFYPSSSSSRDAAWPAWLRVRCHDGVLRKKKTVIFKSDDSLALSR